MGSMHGVRTLKLKGARFVTHPCVCRAQSNNELTREIFVKHGCVNAKIYTSTFNMLQQALGAVRRVDLQHLVMQFGCTSCRSVKASGL